MAELIPRVSCLSKLVLLILYGGGHSSHYGCCFSFLLLILSCVIILDKRGTALQSVFSWWSNCNAENAQWWCCRVRRWYPGNRISGLIILLSSILMRSLSFLGLVLVIDDHTQVKLRFSLGYVADGERCCNILNMGCRTWNGREKTGKVYPPIFLYPVVFFFAIDFFLSQRIFCAKY